MQQRWLEVPSRRTLTQAVQRGRRKEDLVALLCAWLVNERHWVAAIVGLERAPSQTETVASKAEHADTLLSLQALGATAAAVLGSSAQCFLECEVQFI